MVDYPKRPIIRELVVMLSWIISYAKLKVYCEGEVMPVSWSLLTEISFSEESGSGEDPLFVSASALLA